MAGKTVFISSTFVDLKEHRRNVWEVLKRFDVAVRGMEQFGARTGKPLETCLAEVEQSDVYVGIIAYRLGTIDQEMHKPFTVLEYEKAVEQEKEILIYLADDDCAVFPQSVVDKDTKSRKRLDAFKQKLRDQHTVDTFSTAAELAEKLTRDFRERFGKKEPEAEGSVENIYEKTEAVLSEFRLLPKTPQRARSQDSRALLWRYLSGVAGLMSAIQPRVWIYDRFASVY